MNAKVATPGANASACAPRRGLRFAPRPGSAGRTHSRPLAASYFAPARMRRAGPARQRRAGIVGTRIRATLRDLRVPSNP